MPRIEGGAGPIPVSSGSTSGGKSVATVQLGESKLSEVAKRLGIDSDSLHNANPQVGDPNQLKVGQELNLPPFQGAQTLKQNDESSRQSQSSQSGLPRAPIGDALAKNAMQARLSASDLSQVPGGVQQLNSSQLKFTGTMTSRETFVKVDKWSKEDKPLGPNTPVGAEQHFQKADDLAQVAGGAGHVDLRNMKEFGKVADADHLKDASKLIDANKAIKPDKSADQKDDFAKVDQTNKIFDITQDVTVNKAKTADKASKQMDDYIRQ